MAGSITALRTTVGCSPMVAAEEAKISPFKYWQFDNEGTLAFLDAHQDELAGREYDMAVADSEAVQRRARSAVEAIDKTILWLTLKKGR
jgi:hypothetical protein